MRTLTVAARDVRVGDRIHNPHAFHPSAAWLRVTAITTHHENVALTASGFFFTWKHRDEAVAVQRSDDERPA